MLMLPQHHVEIVRRFSCCGLPETAALNLAVRLEKIEFNRGTASVITVLKGLQSYFLGYRDGQPFTKKVHEDGTLWGDFRPLSRLALKGRAGLKSALRCVKIYGLLEASRPDQDDYEKFNKSLKSEGFTPRLIAPRLVTLEDRWLSNFSFSQAKFDNRYPLGNTRAPIAFGKTKLEKDVTPEEHLMTLREFPHLAYNHLDFISKLLPVKEMSFSPPMRNQQDCAGRVIGLTKDRGMKKRFIANPYRVIQLLLSRLKNASEDFLRSLPESAVYDQMKGMHWVKERLIEEKKLYSLDLSSCTDNLPLVFQLELLHDLFPSLKEDIDIFEAVSRMNWKTPFNNVSWEKGQPLGTGPSFSSFTIFHIFLVRSLGGHAGNFRVIGDDIVISSKPLANLYIEAIKNLGVEISLSKSLFDSSMAEFAGRIIDKHGTYNVFKASPTDIQKDPVGLIRQYGDRGFRKLKLPLVFKKQLQLCFRLFHGTISRADLEMINCDDFFEIFVNKPTLVSERPISSRDTSKVLLPGETSGIPDVFMYKTIGYDAEGKEIKDFRYHSEKYSLSSFFSEDHVGIFCPDGFRSAQYPLGLGVWSVDIFDENLYRQHVNANLKDDQSDYQVTERFEEKAKALGLIPEVLKFEVEDKKPISYFRKIIKKLYNK